MKSKKNCFPYANWNDFGADILNSFYLLVIYVRNVMDFQFVLIERGRVCETSNERGPNKQSNAGKLCEQIHIKLMFHLS